MDKGLKIARLFTRQGEDVFSRFTYIKKPIVVRDVHNSIIFEQQDVEVPDHWSSFASEMLAQKFFRKTGVPLEDGKTGGEHSVRQVVHRLAFAWKTWALKYGYLTSEIDAAAFYDELVYMLLSQKAAPNSPQWFNTGLYEVYGLTGPAQGHWYIDTSIEKPMLSESAYTHPQLHACFILSVKDDLVNPGGIMDLFLREARVFKYGSGSGTNFSVLRGEKESLSGGGISSGVISFLRVGDAAAGAVRSGGTTRRAAKMVILDVDHPEIRKFIQWKVDEEKKAQALIGAGYSSSFEGVAYGSVSGQFSNNAVRVSDAFMESLERNGQWPLIARTTGKCIEKVDAKKIWNELATAAWTCGDPGVQFDTTINHWNTCAADGRIQASNPCAEYMFLDDTACNLASVNVLQFFNKNSGEFDHHAFIHACRLWSIVLDLSVHVAQYPSAEVAQRSFDYRTIGLGFTNLGAAIMRMGWAYDSKLAREFAAGVAALMTAVAYQSSSEMAMQLGAFNRYDNNSTVMQGVIRQHVDALQDRINSHKHSVEVETPWVHELQEMAMSIWKDAEKTGDIVGYRNAQVTVVAPTGTIGLLMDCDTLGIEPEFSLVKEKQLVGGEVRKIINRQVVPALRKLNYTPAQVDQVQQLLLDGSVEAALQSLHVKDKPVFACAANGTISIKAHLEMMAVVQPYISGAISKTVNLQNDATVDDVQSCFYTAWKLGLKAISIYRDGCKASQPLKLATNSTLHSSSTDTPLCNECGFITVREGSCFHCPNCGDVIGCT